jgi:hypothetical protein
MKKSDLYRTLRPEFHGHDLATQVSIAIRAPGACVRAAPCGCTLAGVDSAAKVPRTHTEDSMPEEPNDKKPQEDINELTEKDLASTAGGMLDGIKGEETDIKHKGE